MIGFALARRYAKAIIDLAQEQGVVVQVGDDLERVARLLADNPDLIHAFSDPTVSLQEKENVLKEILAKGTIQDLTMRFLYVLLEKNRILGAGGIHQAYLDLADQLANRVRARVVTAAPLDKAQEKMIQAALARISGKEVVLLVEVDESLLGGIVTYMGGQVYDGSISNQLHLVKESLSKGR